MEISQNTHDLVIRNGKIIDGSGKKPFFGDIAIDDGKITSLVTRIGEELPTSRKNIS